MMFLVQPERRFKIVTALNEAGGQASPVHLTSKRVRAWQSQA